MVIYEPSYSRTLSNRWRLLLFHKANVLYSISKNKMVSKNKRIAQEVVQSSTVLVTYGYSDNYVGWLTDCTKNNVGLSDRTNGEREAHLHLARHDGMTAVVVWLAK